MQFPDHPLWDFAIATYSAPGVAEACLELQETLGIDVNILLACAWSGWQGRRLEPSHIDAVCDAVREWHQEVVKPLRAVRKRMKQSLDGADTDKLQLSLRAGLQKIEIDMEHAEQLRIAASLDAIAASGGSAGAAQAVENMALYLESVGADIGPKIQANLQTIAHARTKAGNS